MGQEQMMSGDLTVIGRDRIEIRLQYGRPDTVLVEFKGNPNHVPCDPHHDTLEFEIHERHHGFFLVIAWSVSSARKIVWAASFS